MLWGELLSSSPNLLSPLSYEIPGSSSIVLLVSGAETAALLPGSLLCPFDQCFMCFKTFSFTIFSRTSTSILSSLWSHQPLSRHSGIIPVASLHLFWIPFSPHLFHYMPDWNCCLECLTFIIFLPTLSTYSIHDCISGQVLTLHCVVYDGCQESGPEWVTSLKCHSSET